MQTYRMYFALNKKQNKKQQQKSRLCRIPFSQEKYEVNFIFELQKMLTHSVIVIDIPFVAYKLRHKDEKNISLLTTNEWEKGLLLGKDARYANTCPTTTCLKNASYANKRPTMTSLKDACYANKPPIMTCLKYTRYANKRPTITCLKDARYANKRVIMTCLSVHIMRINAPLLHAWRVHVMRINALLWRA